MDEKTLELERAHLADTVEKTRKESAVAETEYEAARKALEYALASHNEEARPFAEQRADDTYRRSVNLRAAILKPYFTRIDFAETGHACESVYIGKCGVMDSETLDSYVYDWRAPIANLYYMGQPGHVSYDAPEGTVEGELTLKRQFEIENSLLLNAFDTDIASQDEYLQQALSRMSADRLGDIVTTIQAEQYDVIRRPLTQNLIVQGAAGSGKTTIALHRAAYLMYANAGRLRGDNILILAPSPLFLNYISGVLPDLGVENVRQDTFGGFACNVLGLFKQPPAASDAPESALKGRACLMGMADSFWEGYICSFIPEKGITFGPVSLFSGAEFEQFLLRDEAGFPLEIRLEALRKQLKKRVNAAAADVKEWYKKETARREELIRQKNGDKDKLNALRTSLETRLKQVDDLAASYTDKFFEALPSVNPIDVWRAFWRAQATDPEFGACAAYVLSQKRFEAQDVALLGIFTLKLRQVKLPGLRHVVIDEAQDLSPLQFLLLKALAPNATFTCAGDLMQGISASGGTNDWQEILDGVFKSRCAFVKLTTSYRSTREIMNEAFRLRARLGETDPITVVRSGSPVEYLHFENKDAQAALISSLVQKYQAQGRRAIAVIARDAADAKALAKRLPELKLLDTGAKTYESGACITSAADSKGLEFDACVLADACRYGTSPLETRLMYVAMTRALHEMTVLYSRADFGL